MGHQWEEPSKRRSPMDSGNNGTWVEKLARILAERRKAKKSQGKKKKS